MLIIRIYYNIIENKRSKNIYILFILVDADEYFGIFIDKNENDIKNLYVDEKDNKYKELFKYFLE